MAARRTNARASSSNGKAARTRTRRRSSRATSNGNLAGLDKERLLWMYRTMRRIRRFEETAEVAYQAAKMRGALHFYIGEEASATGVCAALNEGDFITSTHRGHGHCIAKGARLDKMMAELYGRTTGYCGGKGGSMHIADVASGNLGANGIVGAGIPIAVGAALGSKLRNDGKVTICFFGDAAGPTGAFHEGVNLGSVLKVPVVFVCENNQYGMATSSDFANASPVGSRGPAYGMPSEQVDGNDVFAVYERAKVAIERARKGEGPSLIETITYRHRGHTIHDQKGYRSEKEIAEWIARDPIERFKRSVSDAKALTAAELQSVDDEVEQTVTQAEEFAEASPWPTVDSIERDVYVE